MHYAHAQTEHRKFCISFLRFQKIRKAVLGQQSQLEIEPDRGEWIPDVKFKDVPLVWHDGHVNAMAVQRGKGRIVVVQGDNFLREFVDSKTYMQLRESLASWLTNGTKNVQFSKSSDSYEQNDIVIISRDQSFDVDILYSKITSGVNAALIGYKTIDGKDDDATGLLNKLMIQFRVNNREYDSKVVSLQPFVEASLCLPIECQIRNYINSWKTFRTESFVNIFTWKDWDSEETQLALKELIRKYGDYMASIAPCNLVPYKRKAENSIALLNYNVLLQFQQSGYVSILPGVDNIMGKVFTSYSVAKTLTITVNSDVGGQFFPTCAYLNKGEQFGWTVLNTTAAVFCGQFIRVNSLTDRLDNLSEIRRWPLMTFKRPLTRQGKMASPHGGPIFLELPAGISITIQFTNVHQHACIDLRDPNLNSTFSTPFSGNHYLPQGVVLGDAMYSVLATEYLEDSSKRDVINSAHFFDQCIKLMHNYRGTKYTHAKIEVLVTDVQPRIQRGHSGYPIVGTVDLIGQFGKWDQIRRGHLRNILHLIGRHLRVFPSTLKNGAGVVGDVFQLVCLNRLLNIPTSRPGEGPLFTKTVVDNMVSIWNQTEYQGLDFGYYAYLHSLFGDGLIGNLFRKSMRAAEQLRTTEMREQFWLQQISVETGYDMLPFHQLWNMPISKDTNSAINSRPCFLPDDELTRSVPAKVNAILKNKACVRQEPKQVQFAGDLLEGINERRPQSIFVH